jgi:MFS superfamily sulfate permease-like transporter
MQLNRKGKLLQFVLTSVSIGVVVAVLAALIYTIFALYTNTRREGLAGINKEDPDLKCPEVSATCTVEDLVKFGHDISSDPRLSMMETEKINKAYKDREDKSFEKFFFDTLALRMVTAYNTKPNTDFFQKILDEVKKKDVDSDMQCYAQGFMDTAKGLLVGTKDQKTLSVAQSEAVRCYARRFNDFRKCLGATKCTAR